MNDERLNRQEEYTKLTVYSQYDYRVENVRLRAMVEIYRTAVIILGTAILLMIWLMD